jgi:stearoyl-CoA 9-desaturase NADPH oxidoreductase
MSSTTTATPPSHRSNPGLGLLDLMAGPPGIDGYLEQISPMLVTGECRAQVLAAVHGTEESVTLILRPNRVWRGLRAGQFVQVSVEIDGVRHTRCYSPASPETSSRELEITVKRHPEGLVSNFLADHAGPGMVLGLSQADGDFQLPDPRPDAILLIGAGSGITPLMGFLRTLCAEGHTGPVALIQYAPDPERTIYREELERLAAENPNFNLIRSYTRAPGVGELDGHFSPAHLPQDGPSVADAETFACGPPALLDAVRANWGANGLEQRLHVESFVPPSLLPVGEPGEGTIRFAGSDVEVRNNGAAVLEQAEEAGLRPQSGCRMGICHSCTCRKVSGTVKNLLTEEVSSGPDESIQLCVSAPLSDLVIDL